MNQLVCNFAPVRFLPYRELGEFVNVGVVLHCPQTRFFGYRLVSFNRAGRVSKFFPELDENIFESALQGIARELERVQACHLQKFANGEVAPETAKREVAQFLEVIRRREGLLHFGDAGTVLAETPEGALDDLFGRFVERQFPQKREAQESMVQA